MNFEWDLEKNKVNKAKHGISFAEATTVWDSIHVEVENIAHTENGEVRNATLGLIQSKIYVVIWTQRKEIIRLISARRARSNEEKVFYKKIQNN
ncbi:MAG: hypothetical protein A3G32_00010 [Deltaproteobacteria bacterium RIFCSPLOWO2_12_FULL_40_28]|nr:MAG: hypothetical protein A3C45_02805 [Deltaproteobacteria bacterium RIFCSPHIGHO2_02_FULL_40_28]OGQ20300.1 MAG: hypothetical protein A3E27_09390 [Deltaproteobacteria bacterium RIFCSPHIGHO2_12_FULL_40_32]OGQ40753.1 MAG: hypothetical protein A3I69_09405 [Deltaproteobacteria bacterium RIFCSPLOWO2_02_FULL_40_36]OGQ54900.1 MAG: hypothetical protein A3G32_00010 [Deltaproteobacteria bacterium RIFCSPLOWO2_12_FULL_40_28]